MSKQGNMPLYIAKKIPSIFASILLIIFASGCKEVEKKLDDYLFEAHHIWQFDGAALVAVDGKIILSRGYGMANREIGEPNSPQTKFYIGSITKQFTAAAVLKLQEDGLLNIKDPISKYLPDYPKETGDIITLEQLLSHESGIPNYTDSPDILLRRLIDISPEELIDFFKDKPLDFPPGSAFEYSNSNYVLLGKIIEMVSGQSYEAYLHRKILKPAGMFNSGYARRVSRIPDRADGYTLEEHGNLIDALKIHFSILHSAGALYSTTGDMFLWDQALYDNSVLNEASRELMFRPNLGNYGFGCFIEKKFGRRHIFHGGFLDGFNCIYERWPDDHLCIIVFSNDDEAPVKKIARGLAAILFNKPYTWPVKKEPIAMDSATLAEYTGAYKIKDDFYRYIDFYKDTLSTYLSRQQRWYIYPQAKDTFFFSNDNTRLLVFNRDSSNQISDISIIDDYMMYPEGKKVQATDSLNIQSSALFKPLLPDSLALKKYAGEYWLDSYTSTENQKFTIAILSNGSKLFASVSGSYPVELLARSENVFSHEVADFSITFIADDNGEVTGCIIDMNGSVIKGVKIN